MKAERLKEIPKQHELKVWPVFYDALVEENNAIAHELEVYGAEDEPRVNVHKHLFRLAAALLRRNATTIERQGKALRAVAELVQRWRRDIDPANQVDKHEPFYDEGIEDSADELEMTLKAALAQTEPQP